MIRLRLWNGGSVAASCVRACALRGLRGPRRLDRSTEPQTPPKTHTRVALVCIMQLSTLVLYS